MSDPSTIAGEIIDRWLASTDKWTGSAKQDTATMQQLIADAICSERAAAYQDHEHLTALLNAATREREECRTAMVAARRDAQEARGRHDLMVVETGERITALEAALFPFGNYRTDDVPDGGMVNAMIPVAQIKRAREVCDGASLCRHVNAFIDAALPEPTASAFRAHLTGCETCFEKAHDRMQLGVAVAKGVRVEGTVIERNQDDGWSSIMISLPDGEAARFEDGQDVEVRALPATATEGKS